MPPDNASENLRDLELLRAGSSARPIGVDREKNILRGYVVAQLGVFKDEGRGEFDQQGLDMLLQLGLQQSKQGVKARFRHPTECDDGLGKYLGRSRDWFMSEAVNAEGKTVPAIRADLHFDKTALDTPPGGGKPLGVYVMDLAESDPDAISSSVGIRTKKEYRLNANRTRMTGPNGEELPPLWFPQKLFASDIVNEGAAVDGLLSADLSVEGMPNAALWKGVELLNGMFDEMPRVEVASRLSSFVNRYLDRRYGPEDRDPPPPLSTDHSPEQSLQPSISTLLLRQRQRELESLS